MSVHKLLMWIQLLILLAAIVSAIIIPSWAFPLMVAAAVVLGFQLLFGDSTVSVVALEEEKSISPIVKLVVIIGSIAVIILAQYLSLPSEVTNTAITILLTTLGINVGVTFDKLSS